MTTDQLPLTGERTVPGIPEENYWFRRHDAAYRALLPECADAVVLEAGCGEGYGANLIAGVANRVLALDYDELTTAHVAARYPRVHTIRGNLASLPIQTSTVDVIASLQVIEHLWDQRGFLAECHRTLRPGGRLLISTPNRITFSRGSATPLNPFHTRELDPSELVELLSTNGFSVRHLTGLRHGSRLSAVDEKYGGSIVQAQLDVAVSGQPWPARLLNDVVEVSTSDFVVDTANLDDSLDLVAIAVREQRP
jgi:SAM-dependent methyltransferase